MAEHNFQGKSSVCLLEVGPTARFYCFLESKKYSQYIFYIVFKEPPSIGLNCVGTPHFASETTLLTNICQAAPFDPPAPPNLRFCGCDFDWRQTSARSFQQYGVQRPTQASRWSRQRQSEYIAGRYCAIQALTALADHNSPSAMFQIPISDDLSPRWPHGTVGSISHSQHRAIAIAARDTDYSGMGIDCETLLTDSAAAEIAPWVLQRNDLNCKIEVPLSYGFWITLIFSAKESLFKALAPTYKNVVDFGHLSSLFFVSRITEKALILNTELSFNKRSQFTSQSSSQSSSQFELIYRVDNQQIITMVLLAPQ